MSFNDPNWKLCRYAVLVMKNIVAYYAGAGVSGTLVREKEPQTISVWKRTKKILPISLDGFIL